MGVNYVLDWCTKQYEKLSFLLKLQKVKKETKEKNDELLELIFDAKEKLSVARNNFNYVTDESLLEYKIYEVKAAEKRLGYYLKLAKDKELQNDNFVFLKDEKAGVTS